MNKKISVVGSGYVGISNALLLSQKNDVTILDIDQSKVDMINCKVSPYDDKEFKDFFEQKDLRIKATINKDEAYESVDYIILALPTDFNESKNYFDTSIIEEVISDISSRSLDSVIIIKSTIPVGFTNEISSRYPSLKIIFSPEFLREGSALFDNLYPTRIIIGSSCEEAKEFASLLVEGAEKENIQIIHTESSEAESIKLFANTYLAMRVSFFNELDSFCLLNNLNSYDVINGVCLDERIGKNYNNPSFGYGGYCLPKDTKQLLSNFKNTPQNIISAIVDSNNTRKKVISDTIISKGISIVGIYRLVMKKNSDNIRSSSIVDVIDNLKKSNVQIIIYEPEIKDDFFEGCKIENDINLFKNKSEIIVCNRLSSEIEDVKDKVFTRDIFNEN